jgi:two-component system, NtrC family, sensor kinase
MDRGAKTVKAKAGAKLPAARRSRPRATADNRTVAQRLADALAQQAATAEILRVMAASPTDVKPVLDAVAQQAARLCHAPFGAVILREGDSIRTRAQYSGDGESTMHMHTVPLQRTSITGRAILDRATIHHPDVAPLLGTEYPDARENARKAGFRAVLAVPLVRDSVAYGAVLLWRREPGLFAPDQVALVETFATQAAIAIENVRQFRATQEALEQQTATSEILRVISQSQTDVQPVFDTIAANALRLCEADFSALFRFDGEQIHIGSFQKLNREATAAFRTAYPCPPNRGGTTQRAILTSQIVHIPDIHADPEYTYHKVAYGADFRSALSVPMLRDGRPIGTITVYRVAAKAFPDSQIELLKTFADQAVIAIENVRLFKELEVRNRDLTEALEQQTATSEILRVISSSPTDIGPVLDALVRSATRFCGAYDAVIFLPEADSLRVGAHHGPILSRPVGLLVPVVHGTVAGRSLLERRTIHVADLQAERQEFPEGSVLARKLGHRTTLSVPLMRESAAIGVIQLRRSEVNPFSDKQMALLQTFADQAVIAIENVRLFKELEARTSQLTRSVGELKALGEVGQAVSSTLDLETVLATIVSRATQLADVDGGSIYEYDEAREEFSLRTADGLPDELVEAMRAAPIRKGEGILGQMAMTGEPVQIPDIIDERSYQSRVRETLLHLGYRSLLTVPLLRENHLLGGLTVNRTRPGEFDAEVIALLQTFASQSALAIQNARLFREIEAKGRQLEIASQHKSDFLANMSHELRTPLNAIIGFSEVLGERLFGEMNDKQAEYVGDITESGRHLLSLINEILDLSKIEAGRMELDLAEFDLATTVDNTLALVRERAQRREIRLNCSIDERVATILADERKVKQVLLNLLSNALKFTPEGGTIDVRAGAHGERVEISVTDTGVGIAPEDLEAVFEEFRQVGFTAKKIEGTGLGLAISRKFVELHGGKIWVTSQVGAGSTFAFTLPLKGHRHEGG